MNLTGQDFCPQTYNLGKLLELRISTEDTMSLEEIAYALDCSENLLWTILLGNVEFKEIPRRILENCAAFLAIPMVFLYVKVGALPTSDFSVKGQNRFRHAELHDATCDMLSNLCFSQKAEGGFDAVLVSLKHN